MSFSGDIRDDLSRRDFTVNSIAYNEIRGFVDPFDGIGDIKRKIIKATGEPQLRFKEDALRILRALRFCVKLGFAIEAETEAAMFSCKELLGTVHPQRIKKELEGILTGELSVDFPIKYKDILSVIMPEIAPMFETSQNTPHHIYNVYEHTAHVVANTPYDISLRLAALYHDCGKPAKKTTDETGRDHFKGHAERSVKLCENALLRMGFPFEVRNEVLTLIKYHDERYRKGSYSVKKVLNAMPYSTFEKLLILSRADIMSQSEYRREEKLGVIEFAECEAERILESGECYNLSMLKITGEDLIKLGFNGKNIGIALEELLNLVMKGEVLNEKYELLSFSKSIFDKI